MQSFENCVTCSLLTLNHPTVIHWWYTLFICSSAICRWFSPTHAWPHTWGSSSCRNTVVLTSLAYREREKVFKHHTKKERSQLTQYWEYPVPSLGIVGSDFKGNCQAEQKCGKPNGKMWKGYQAPLAHNFYIFFCSRNSLEYLNVCTLIHLVICTPYQSALMSVQVRM